MNASVACERFGFLFSRSRSKSWLKLILRNSDCSRSSEQFSLFGRKLAE